MRWWKPLLLVVGLAVLAGTAWLILRLPDWLIARPQHEGRSSASWMADLDTPDPDKRREAIFALGAIGADAGEAVPALAVILLEDPEGRTRNAAALALTKMLPASRQAVPAMTQALDDKDRFVRMNVAMALSRLGTDARPAVPALIRAIKNEDNKTNLNAFTHTIQEISALALGRASAGSADGVPALTEALEAATTPTMRMAVVRALGAVGPEARPAVPRLRTLLDDKDRDVREVAQEALKRIEDRPAPKKDGPDS
jgi:HEAT repeat protein